MAWYVLAGVVFGIVGGMGLGGGIVLIPCLTLLLGMVQHEAQGMTLFAYIPMALVAIIMHVHKGNVRLRFALWLTLFGVLGGAAGYGLASVLEPDTLRSVFAVFLIIVALLRIYRFEIRPRQDKKKTR